MFLLVVACDSEFAGHRPFPEKSREGSAGRLRKFNLFVRFGEGYLLKVLVLWQPLESQDLVVDG